jgi:hypothetical protein
MAATDMDKLEMGQGLLSSKPTETVELLLPFILHILSPRDGFSKMNNFRE